MHWDSNPGLQHVLITRHTNRFTSYSNSLYFNQASEIQLAGTWTGTQIDRDLSQNYLLLLECKWARCTCPLYLFSVTRSNFLKWNIHELEVWSLQYCNIKIEKLMRVHKTTTTRVFLYPSFMASIQFCLGIFGQCTTSLRVILSYPGSNLCLKKKHRVYFL